MRPRTVAPSAPTLPEPPLTQAEIDPKRTDASPSCYFSAPSVSTNATVSGIAFRHGSCGPRTFRSSSRLRFLAATSFSTIDALSNCAMAPKDFGARGPQWVCPQ